MKPIHWLFLICAAFFIGMYVMRKLQPVLALPAEVTELKNEMSEVEARLAQHEARWRWLNRAADVARKFLRWGFNSSPLNLQP